MLINQTRRLAPILAMLLLATLACGKKDHPWSISPAAIEALDLDLQESSHSPENGEPASRCSQTVHFEMKTDLNLDSADPSDLASTLLAASKVDVRCEGSPVADLTCRPHHRLRLADRNYGETTCTYHPDSAASCRLVVGWGIGPDNENQIQKLYCEATEYDVDPCDLRILSEPLRLRLTCGT